VFSPVPFVVSEAKDGTVPLWQVPMASMMASFGRWFAIGVGHAFGNPREEKQLQPPSVGVQPYRDRPYRP